MNRLPLRAALALALLLLPGRGRAGGFEIYEHSALATGMADARTALWDDPSAMFYNPAAITQLPGFQLSAGDTLLIPTIKYTPNGRTYAQDPTTHTLSLVSSDECATAGNCHSTDAELHVFPPAHIYLTAEILPGFSAGLGYNSPFGLGTYWPANWDGRFTAYQTYIETHFVEPVLAVDVAQLIGAGDQWALSFAAGGYYVHGKATIVSEIDGSQFGGSGPPDPVAQMALNGTADGGGYTFSLFAAYKNWVSIGASVRSHVVLDFAGTAVFTAPDATWSQMMNMLGLLPNSTPGSTSVDLPWNMNFGVAFHGLPHFTFDADVYVAMWSSFDQLAVHFDCEHRDPPNNCGSALNDAAKYPKQWHTGIQASFGVEYRPIRDLALRVGYGYVTDPSNPTYYDGQLPDGNRHLITVGIGYRAPELFKVDVGYMLALWSNTKDNAIGGTSTVFHNVQANGDYDTITHVIAVTFGFSFDTSGMAPPPTLDASLPTPTIAAE